MFLYNNDIEKLHQSGQMPDWIYYQLNGKSIEENFAEIYNKRQEEMREKMLAERLDAKIEEEIDKIVPDMIDKAIKDIFGKQH